MADANLLKDINSTGEADTSWILDTLMYSDALGDTDFKEHTVEEIVKELQGKKLPSEYKEAVDNVGAYLETHPNSSVSKLKLSSCSDSMGNDYKGAKGATFYSENPDGTVKDVYVAFRGTGDGRWYDNGDAFNKRYSEYQQDSAQYFDYAMTHIKTENGQTIAVSDECNVITTGHSKGGNLSQFVALGSSNAYLVDRVISFDGQGFSPEAITYFKTLYGEEFYENQLQKMYSVSGDNDYVNVLGIKVIPEDHTVYIETPSDVYDLPNGHAPYDGTVGNLFNYSLGTFNPQTDKQRELALFAKSLSDNIMSLPPEQREDVCRSLMSLLEYSFSGGPGLNGESATTEEMLGFFSYIDAVVDELLYTKKGQDFINKSVNELIRSKLPFDENTTVGKIATFIVAGYIQGRLQGALCVAEFILDGLSGIIATGAKVVDAFRVAYEFCGNVVSGLKELYKYVTDSNYRAAQDYLSHTTIIQLHTQDLHDLAQRLWAVNGRLESLDHRLDNLYKQVKWTDLWNLLRADFKVGWSSKINSCANCLNDTANRFESAEQQILGLMG